MRLHVLKTPEALMHYAADYFVAQAQRILRTQTRFTIALSGGATPKPLYTLLASAEYATQVDWAKIHLFFVDERGVPPDHAESNYRMVQDALLQHVTVGQVHRIQGELAPQQAAAHYQQVLHQEFGGLPQFDLIWLGMGADGHTASLFPHTAAVQEQEQWVIAHHITQFDQWRVTLTPPVLNAAAEVVFLVVGANKAATLKQVLHGVDQPALYPAQIIKPAGDKVLWLLDAAAAAQLTH
jgi:6-phosphogluconolactonase